MSTERVNKAGQQWALIADSIPLLLCLIDRQGKIIRANRTIERWELGTVASVKNKSLHETLHPRCMTPGCPLHEFEQEAFADLVDGRHAHMEGFDPLLRRHLAINVQPIIKDGGNRDLDDVLAVVSIDDVSELKRAEKGVLCLQSSLRLCIVQEIAKRQEIEEIQSRLLTILSKTPNFIALADADGNVFYINDAGRAMLQVEDDYSTRLRLTDCLTPDAQETLVSEALPTALAQGMWSGPSVLRARNGRRVPTNQVVIAHQNPNGTLAGYSIVEQDMSAWVEAEGALRRSEEELRRLSSQLLDVQENERRRIAGDLHDVIGQSLSLIKLSIDDAVRLVDAGEARAAGDALRRLGGRVKDALVEVQRVSMDLRPSTLDDLGILATLSWFFREFEESCRHIRVSKEINVREEHIPSPLKTTIFRILQEATANIVKHAAADQIRVALTRQGDLLELTVEDNGQGFDPAQSNSENRRHGLGLRSMRERTRLSGGTYVLESALGHGTRIHASWPAATTAE